MGNKLKEVKLSKAVGLTCAEASLISQEDAELPENFPFDDILAVETQAANGLTWKNSPRCRM